MDLYVISFVLALHSFILSFFHSFILFHSFSFFFILSPFPQLHSAKSKLNQQIDEQINNKIKQRDQMLGRLPQQGWLRLRLNSSNNTTGQEELIFSPIEQESSFFSSESESEIGKRENYQTNYEKVRSVIIDSMADTQEMRMVMHQELEVVMSKLASMKQFTTTNGAADLFAQFNRGKCVVVVVVVVGGGIVVVVVVVVVALVVAVAVVVCWYRHQERGMLIHF